MLQINPAVVISNNPNAKGLKLAENLGVKTEIIISKDFKGKRWDYDKKIITVLKRYRVTPTNGLGDKKMMKIEDKIECWNCNAQIITYHDVGYNGKRGRCPICGVDFPLE